ncbi:MAG: tRNA-modifying protein YgfZ [Buchnera aphidicola (Floraphis choui)]
MHNNLSRFFEKDIILMTLNDWTLTKIIGSDSKKYLQNQITIDMNKLSKKKHKLCAHCNVNGRVWSNLRIFQYEINSYMYLQRKSVSYHQINELKKYSIFSNISIFHDTEMYLLGITGTMARTKLQKYFDILPNKNLTICYKNNVILLWFNFPCERFILITKKNNAILKKILSSVKTIHDSNLWLALDISSKFPIIEKEMSGKFFPQSLNLENLDALDFKKGCYYGQEMITKIRFRKLNQYNLHWLIEKSDRITRIGEIIESKIQEKWNRVGYILSFVRVNKNTIWIQAVLKINVKINDKIRIENDINSKLYMQM